MLYDDVLIVPVVEGEFKLYNEVMFKRIDPPPSSFERRTLLAALIPEKAADGRVNFPEFAICVEVEERNLAVVDVTRDFSDLQPVGVVHEQTDHLVIVRVLHIVQM